VATNLRNESEVRAAYAAAVQEEPTVVVERFIEGSDYRLLVIGKRLVAAARRDPARVIGDGVSTVRELVEQANLDPRRSDGHSTVMSLIKIDELALGVLLQQGLTPDAIPSVDQVVLIRRNANLSTGGSAVDVTDRVHPDVAARAVEAAQMVGLDIAGVDIVARDIGLPMEAQGAAIVEVNAGPGLRMHLQPSEGSGQPVGEAIVDLLFGLQASGRIPIVAVTGVNGKTTTTRLVAHILSMQGKRVGMTATEGVYVAGRQIDVGDCSGPRSARRLLMNPRVDAAVLETARGGILREGLAFDRCDVAVVTNIGEGDHLGIGPIQTLEQLAKVKRTIVDVVAADGCGVLNADDPLVVEMAEHCPGSIAWFSHHAGHPRLAQHRAAGGRVVFVRDQSLVLAQGNFEFSLINLEKVPLTLGGKIRFQIENAMAAVAATWALGVPAEIIRAGLESFLPSLESCPGRFNLLEWRGATMIVDYGHNPSALQGVIDSLVNFPPGRRLAVYSAAGDRRDCDMIRQGQQLGDAFDLVCLYEGDYVRGRERGDITRLIEQGLKQGQRVSQIKPFGTWNAAADFILANAGPGDIVLLQADSVEESLPYLRQQIVALTASPQR
jgi:cyanophycin synthetase